MPLLGLGSSLSKAAALESAILATNAKSIAFDGTDEYIDLFSDYDSIDSLAAFTFVAWIKASNTGGSEPIFSKTKDDNENLTIKLSGNKLYFMVENGSDSDGYVDYTDNDWNHIACVFDGSQTGNADRCKIYVNGVNQTLTFSGTIPSAIDDLSGYPSYIGRQSTAYYTGNIDEIGIWSSALTATEVKAIYDNLSLDFTQDSVGYASSSNLKSWWRMGDDIGALSSSNNYYIPNVRKTFITGKSIDFDGTDEYVNMSQLPSVAADTAFSYSLWTKKGDDSTTDYILGRSSDLDNIKIKSNEAIEFRIGGSSSFTNAGTISNVTTTWNHIVLTRDASNNAKIYLNGVEQGIWNGSSYATGGKTVDAISNIDYIARDSSAKYEGKVCDVAHWDVELSSADVTSIYNSGEPNDLTLSASYDTDRTSNLKAYLKLGDGTDGTLKDIDGADNGSPYMFFDMANTTYGSNIAKTGDDILAAWNAEGNNTNSVADGVATLTYVDTGGSTTNSFKARFHADAASDFIFPAGTTLYNPGYYKVNMTAKVNSGTVKIYYLNSNITPYASFGETSYTDLSFIVRRSHNDASYLSIQDMGAGQVMNISSMTVQYLAGNHGLSYLIDQADITEDAPGRHTGLMVNFDASGDVSTDVPS